MNFEQRTILVPLAGNNASQRSVSVRVMGDTPAMPSQMANLANCYDLFKMNARLSLAGFLSSDGVLEDGSHYRVVSNSGMDFVMLWPAGAGESSALRLPHGFAVVSNWHAPIIFKYRPASSDWQVATDRLPQITQRTEVLGYNQILRINTTPARTIVYPAIYVDKKLELWDFGPHAAPSPRGATYSVPANLAFPDAAGHPSFNPARTHYMMDDAIEDGTGNTLYMLADPGALLGGGATPEPLTPLPGCTDATGTTAALQLVRMALLSETADLWKYRFCNEAITRTAEKTYVASARYVVDVSLPIGSNDGVADATTTNSLGLSLPTPMFAVNFFSAGQATVPMPPFDGGGSSTGNSALGFYGASRIFTDLSAATAADVSYKRTYSKTSGAAAVIDKTIALPAADAVEYAKLTVNLHYPATMSLAGGTVTWSHSYTPSTGERGYSREGVAAKRVDATHNVDGAPDVSLDLTWATVRLLEGTTTGRLAGIKHVDTYTDYKRGGDFTDYSFAIAAANPATGPMTQQHLYDLWTAEPNLIGPWQAEWLAFPVPSPTHAPGANSSSVHDTTLQDTPITCTGDYLLTSRHIIDYDHRSRFFAAIRCEVQCSGAAWGQNPTGYLGEIIKTADPTYTVNIYFECDWNGVVAQQLLATATGTRPAFEFTQWRVRNIYTYPSDDTLQPMDYWMPPEPGLPKEVMSSLVNLSLHQGVNTHQVARMFYPSVPDGAVSPDGIEYTRAMIDKRGDVNATLQTRFVDGQLYARTFKLSDDAVKDALWMLHALCVDAPANNHYPTDGSDPQLWYYLPAMGDVVKNTAFHIEVRNGIIGQWSDEIAPDGDVMRPAANARDIKLYEV